MRAYALTAPPPTVERFPSRACSASQSLRLLSLLLASLAACVEGTSPPDVPPGALPAGTAQLTGAGDLPFALTGEAYLSRAFGNHNLLLGKGTRTLRATDTVVQIALPDPPGANAGSYAIGVGAQRFASFVTFGATTGARTQFNSDSGAVTIAVGGDPTVGEFRIWFTEQRSTAGPSRRVLVSGRFSARPLLF